MGVVKQRGVRSSGGFCRIRFRGKNFEIDETLDVPYTSSGVITAARILAKRVAHARLHGVNPAMPTLAEWGQKWLDSAGLRPSSRQTAKRHLNKIWLPSVGNPPIDQIDIKQVRQALSTTSHLSSKTRENYLGTLRSCLQMAVDDGVIDINPAVGIRLKSTAKKSKPDPFTLDERDAIIREMRDISPSRLGYWAIRFFAGTRPSETLALEWADYNRKNRQLTVSKQIQSGVLLPYTKTTADGQPGRTTYVVKPLREILATLPRDIRSRHIVSTVTGTPFADSRELVRDFNRVLKRLGFRYRSPYNARHTCATDMLERGIDPAIAADELGHSPQMFLTVYATWLNQDRKKAAYALWDAEL